VPSILSIISREQKKPDTSALLDLFSLPANEGRRKPDRKQTEKPDGEESGTNMPDITPSPKRYLIQKRADGFVLQGGDSDAPRPHELSIKVAYSVRRGSALAKYNRADFRLDSRDITCELQGSEILECSDNWMRIRIDEDDFEIGITGFDTAHRD